MDSARFIFGILFVSTLGLPAFAGELKITSTEADSVVYEIFSEEGAERNVQLGVTPYSLKDITSKSSRLFKVEKPGFSAVYIPVFGNLQGDLSIKVALKSQSLCNSDEKKLTAETESRAEKLVDEILEVQFQLDQRKPLVALAKAEELRNQHPSSIGVKLVYANALLLSGQTAKAKSAYATLLEELPASRAPASVAPLKTSIEQVLRKLQGGNP